MNIESIDQNPILNTALNTDDVGKKLALSEHIVEAFMPLFCDEIEKKRRLLDSNWQDFNNLTENIKVTEETIENCKIELRREKLIRKILIEINKLVDRQILYGSIKSLVANVINEIQSMDEKELVTNLNALKRAVDKNIPKVTST